MSTKKPIAVTIVFEPHEGRKELVRALSCGDRIAFDGELFPNELQLVNLIADAVNRWQKGERVQ